MRLPLVGLPVPSPGDVLHAVDAVRRQGLMLVELLPRTTALLDRMDVLTVEAEDLLARTDAVLSQAEVATGAAASVAEQAGRLLAASDTVRKRADRVVSGATGMVDRLDAQLRLFEPLLRRLAPTVQRLVDTTAPGEIDAAVGLIDRLPRVLTHLDDDVLPMMRQLDRVGPDLHALLEVVEDVRQVVTGLPGVSLLRKRADEPPPPAKQELDGRR
jgi:hypothetical protein